MNSVAANLTLDATLNEDAWDDLLSFIEDRRVIPIVGPELLMIATDQGPRPLYDWVAERLAARLNVDTRQLPQHFSLDDVVCAFIANRGRREEAYVRREWSYALDRAPIMAEGALFIVPVTLDGITAAAAIVPERFRELHFAQLPGGQVTPEFARRLAEVTPALMA